MLNVLYAELLMLFWQGDWQLIFDRVIQKIKNVDIPETQCSKKALWSLILTQPACLSALVSVRNNLGTETEFR